MYKPTNPLIIDFLIDSDSYVVDLSNPLLFDLFCLDYRKEDYARAKKQISEMGYGWSSIRAEDAVSTMCEINKADKNIIFRFRSLSEEDRNQLIQAQLQWRAAYKLN